MLFCSGGAGFELGDAQQRMDGSELFIHRRSLKSRDMCQFKSVFATNGDAFRVARIAKSWG